MCFPRNPSLGHYNGSREEWRKAYQIARIINRGGEDVSTSAPSLLWKAGSIIRFDRKRRDHLTIPVLNRLKFRRIIEEILKEE